MSLLTPEVAWGTDPGVISYRQDIKPIFQQHCVSCHGGVKNAGDLKLTEERSASTVIDLQSPEQSSLLQRIRSTDPEERMPPPDHGPPLSKEQIDKIERWIRQGAVWERHWAFIPPKPQATPIVPGIAWCRNPIDAFVAQTWEQDRALSALAVDRNRLSEIPPSQWLRRVSLTLTGLVPTLDDYRNFQHALDARDELPVEMIYEQRVDELLASPAFGEHWASMWLDQVRYADSRGLGLDGPRTIWKYRDWVVDAFNRDLPYDRFTTQQIAGDLNPTRSIEDSIATAVHRLTQTNEEGGTDDEEFRTMAVIDRINTTWQVWQGLTFGCVQCHDHPYDPFRHKDYYQFMAYFNNTSDWDLNEEFPLVRVPLDVRDYDRASQLDQKIDELNRSVWEQEFRLLKEDRWWNPTRLQSVRSSKNTQTALDPQVTNEFHTVGTVQRDTDYTIEWPIDQAIAFQGLRIAIRPLDAEKALQQTEVGAVLSHVALAVRTPEDDDWRSIEIGSILVDEPEPFWNPRTSLDAKDLQGIGPYAKIHRERWAALMASVPLDLPAGSMMQLKIAQRMFLLDAFPLVARRMAIDISSDLRLTEQLAAPELVRQREQLAELRKERDKIASVTVPVMRELQPHLRRPTNVFIRGLFLTKDEEVTPNVPAWMLASSKAAPRDRTELADWLVDDENPLTARVQVNRIWGRLLGRGLVATEEDLGSSGESASHPELLDTLAYRFQHDWGWSQKKLIRSIVLSSTYRQSSRWSETDPSLDPANVWLHRGPRVRLSAESIRDVALSLSELIDSRVGGPPSHPPIPDGVWKPFQGNDAWKTPGAGSKDRYRRSIYTYIKRSIPYPMFAAFDAPSREFCTSRRMNSNTPLQALMLLNDETLSDCAKSIAEHRIPTDATSWNDIEETMCELWLQALGRVPSAAERSTLRDYFESEAPQKGARGAFISLALMILNHDELLYP